MEHLDPTRIQDAIRMANSPAGQQLIRHLQESGGDELNRALAQANTGDYTNAKQILSKLVKSPELQTYMNQLRRDVNG